jgi:2-methylcitrate dehydratase PrpD
MTFDQWIDAVNAQVHARLGDGVRTEEISWDSAVWVSSSATAVASLDDDEATARFSFDGGETLALRFRNPEAKPEIVGETVVAHLTGR